MTMNKVCNVLRLLLLIIGLYPFSALFAQTKGLKTITEKELKFHTEFLGSKEFRGRETPSPELEIATLYLGNCFKNIGLKPLMQDGSFYQSVPVTVTAVQPETSLRLFREGSTHVFYFGKSFTGNFTENGSFGGSVVFAGAGISDSEKGWDDLKNLDIKGKVVVILDEQRPEEEKLSGTSLYSRLNVRISEIRKRGAAAVLSVISSEREEKIASGNRVFDYIPTGRIGLQYDSQRTDFGGKDAFDNRNVRPELPFVQAQISQELASQLLEKSKKEIGEMFRMIRKGVQVPAAELKNARVQLDVVVDSYESSSRNVIGMVEGSDPVLKNEYIVVSGHHDGRGIDDGEIIPGADDNVTAVVALLEIGQALLIEKPKRSVILAAFTGEEQGMNGSHYFINNCPVPVEKISTCLNMDMIGRNHSDSLFLVGSDLLSSELDASIRKVNKKSGINFALDYRYSNISHPQYVYFRSDHYPFIRFGIPSVWIFSGFTPDYHTPRDVPEFINYTKFLRITKLVYLTAYETGNLPSLLKLDVNKAVTSRGRQNNTETSLFRAAGK